MTFNPLMVAAVLFGVLFICLLIKIPIAFSLLIASIVTLVITEIPLEVAAQRLFTSLDSFSFLAIPFFILAGNLMGEGGISERLVGFANSMVGHRPGGLAIVSIIACMFFAAISGSGAATVAAIGGIMVPYMVKNGYDKGFSAAVNASAGGIGIIIPPSIPFVSYAVLTGASIGEMFMGGISAGIIIGLCMIIAVVVVSKKRGYTSGIKATGAQKWKAFTDSLLGLIMPIIILGGIYSGKFTATESSVIAVVYGLVIGVFVYKELNMKNLPRIFKDSAATTAQVLFLIAAATLFGWILTRFRVPDEIAKMMMSITSNKIIILILMNILLLIMGTFMDTIASIVIVTPILFPIATSIGMDPIHFGIMMCSNLAIGQITPPFGVNLFVASGVSKVKIEKIVKELVPMFIAMIVAVILITYFEPISMVLVKLFFRG